MSDGTTPYGSDPGTGQAGSTDSEGKLDTAKEEAAALAGSTKEAAKGVVDTAKDEVASVAHETKAQASELFHQARRQFGDQAAAQQQRIAAGLGTVGDELAAMARNSDSGSSGGGSGIAADLVQRASARASGIASWLEGRDPAGLLDDAKAFARRRPLVFIGSALVAGIAAGRLTRALASEAKDAKEDAGSGAPSAAPAGSAPVATPSTPAAAYGGAVGAGAVPSADAPLYEASAARHDLADGGAP